MIVTKLLNLALIYSVVKASSNWKTINHMNSKRTNLAKYFNEKATTISSINSSTPTSDAINCPAGTEYCQSENNCKVPGQKPTEPNCCTSGLVIFKGDSLCYPPTFPSWGGDKCPVNYEYCSGTNTCKLITSGNDGNDEQCPENTVFNTQDKLCHVGGKPPVNGPCNPGDIFNPEDGLCHCQDITGTKPTLTCPKHYKLNPTDSLCHYVLQGSR